MVRKKKKILQKKKDQFDSRGSHSFEERLHNQRGWVGRPVEERLWEKYRKWENIRRFTGKMSADSRDWKERDPTV